MTTGEFELGSGVGLSSLAVGKTIVHRPRAGLYMVVMSVLCGLVACAMLLGAAYEISTSRAAGVLIALEAVVGVVFGLAAARTIPQALADLRFNRLAYMVRFAPDRVVISNSRGEEVVALADAAAHPFLRGLAIDQGVHFLTRVRAACEGLGPLDDRRLILESLLLTDLDPGPEDLDEGSPASPIFAAVPGPGDIRLFRDAEALTHARQQGWPVYSIPCEWDPEAGDVAPVFAPSLVTRVEPEEPR